MSHPAPKSLNRRNRVLPGRRVAQAVGLALGALALAACGGGHGNEMVLTFLEPLDDETGELEVVYRARRAMSLEMATWLDGLDGPG
jgi:hypothetical protein